ncbi:MAG: hypothetical protein PHE53_05140 [Thermoguttaceae bacterium]|nr:hypothetical protein [Thermoguttaceae bacterium]
MIRWSGVDDVTMVATHPNDGATALGQIDSSDIVAVPISRMNTSQPLKQTQKLTVWRTLNVECDAMEYYPDATNIGTVITPPNPSLYLGDFVASELARVCVITNVYSPNTHQPNRGHNPITEIELLQLFGDTFDSNHHPVPDPSATPTTTGRDLAMNANSSDFWAVRIAMVSSDAADTAGCFISGKNTILVYHDTVNFFVQYWNDTHSSHADLDTNLRRVVLHEIGHALISATEGQSGIMLQTNWIHNNTTSEELSFLNSEILDIQKFSRIR